MTQLTVSELTPAFGAEIGGLDPTRKLGDEDRALLRRTFDERGLLRFRDLDLSPEYQQYLASLVIGREGPAPDGASYDTSDVFFVSNKEDDGGAPFGRLLYHCDMMWSDNPFEVLTLYGLEVSEPTVPTIFTSATHAWKTLPADLKDRLEGLHALHMTGQARRAGDEEGELLQPKRENVKSVTRPIPFAHPRTGEPILYVSQMMTRKIVELPGQDSEDLLGEVFAHLYDAALTWQQDWRAGDFVMWDNFAIQHARGEVKVDGPPRTLRKVIAPRLGAGTVEKPRFDKVGS
jgi:alpha-ketoglutarate-dependent taurine dioxygenase